ncbi:MAG: flagellar hook-length control protein FliK, partial [Lachnospiraceae bacterium]|nr:flagellar hook-length control protein FliK [Lachnospiraceae bacterium]
NSTTIMSALDAAGMSASDTAVEMVDTLMQNGMPINKDMLHTINRELSMYPDADVRDIVMLHKMDIPVNDANVRQKHLYNNNNQWMMDNENDSASELTSVLSEALAEGGETAQNILAGLKELLPPQEEIAAGETTTGQENAAAVEGEDAAGNAQALTQDGKAIASDTANMTQSSEELRPSDNVAAQAKDADGNVIIKDSEAGRDNSAAIAGDKQSAGAAQDQPEINKFNIFDKLAKMDPAELSKPETKAQIRDAVTELLKDNFLMNPKDIKEEKFVQKYYERTMNLSEGLEKLMAENGKADTDFARSMTGMKENTTFMNHINDMYNYVQLPLKMNESQANGDLYVYARKKGRGGDADDGKLTALLHLSMEHLGNLDVFLTLSEGQKLNTRFTLEKEEMIDFIASHIDELNARLEKKGYNVATSVTHKDGPDKTVIENITGDKNNILLSTQSFDARA